VVALDVVRIASRSDDFSQEKFIIVTSGCSKRREDRIYRFVIIVVVENYVEKSKKGRRDRKFGFGFLCGETGDGVWKDLKT